VAYKYAFRALVIGFLCYGALEIVGVIIIIIINRPTRPFL